MLDFEQINIIKEQITRDNASEFFAKVNYGILHQYIKNDGID